MQVLSTKFGRKLKLTKREQGILAEAAVLVGEIAHQTKDSGLAEFSGELETLSKRFSTIKKPETQALFDTEETITAAGADGKITSAAF